MTCLWSLKRGSSDEEGTEEFSIISAEHIYYDWLQQLPKSDVKMMAMVAMDTFIARFGLTTVGAAKEVGLFLQLNEKTVRTWRKDFLMLIMAAYQSPGKESMHVHMSWMMKNADAKPVSGSVSMRLQKERQT